MKKSTIVSLLVGASLLALPIAAQAQNAFAVSQSSFDFYYIMGGGLPSMQSGTFTNITNADITAAISVPNQPHWLNSGYNTTAFTLSPGTPSGIGALADPTGLGVGTYSTAIYISGNFTGSPLIFPVTLTIAPSGSGLPPGQAHPEGTNVRGSDGTVYRIIDGYRNPYTSAGAFLSYGFNSWTDVQAANSADLALPTSTYSPGVPRYLPPRDGSLINDKGTIYIMSDGYRQGFTSADVFLGLGYSFANVLAGDTSFLTTLAPINTTQMSHPSGTVVNVNGTICVVQSIFRTTDHTPSRRCFSTLADMNSWGIHNSEIISANAFDKQLTIAGIVQQHTQTSLMNP